TLEVVVRRHVPRVRITPRAPGAGRPRVAGADEGTTGGGISRARRSRGGAAARRPGRTGSRTPRARSPR
ncbi:MFS transporter, partial [Clavibacter phaseoli]